MAMYPNDLLISYNGLLFPAAGKLRWNESSVEIELYQNASINSPHKITLKIPFILTDSTVQSDDFINQRLLNKIRDLLYKERIVPIKEDSVLTSTTAPNPPYSIAIYTAWADVHTIDKWLSFGERLEQKKRVKYAYE